MQIPVQNIYYLLCYAWDKLEEGESVKVSQSDYSSAIELYARVLINGCTHLFKRGLEHNYNSISEEYVGIKGKIDFNRSLNKNLFRQGRAVCQYDEFEVNILQNQLIKATLKRLIRVKGIEKEITNSLYSYYWKFVNVDDIEIHLPYFSQVKIHRNNSFYDFLLKICRLIFENTVLNEVDGTYAFKDFVRDQGQMAGLFEAFIRNFYKKEHEHLFNVFRENITWEATPLGNSTLDYLPQMQTDISLESPTRKIIIETKYYQDALSSRFEGKEKFNSGNLYQLYSYLRNIETKTSHLHNKVSEGILLYPAVGYQFSESYIIGGHKLSVETIDLSKEWKEISRDLILILKEKEEI